jgi:hypothetical protein
VGYDFSEILLRSAQDGKDSKVPPEDLAILIVWRHAFVPFALKGEVMKRVFLLGLFGAFSLSAATYEELVKRVQDGDLRVDFREMRFACLQAKNCSAEGSAEIKKELYAAMRAGQDQKVAEAGEKMIAAGFTNIEAQMMCAMAYKKLGDTEKAKFHHEVAAGLLQSIMANSDGRTKDSAFEVVCTAEEYVVVSVMGLPRLGDQALIAGKPHSYDLLTREDPKSGKRVQVYFKIDAFYPMKGL